jgi:hypothetical protein
MIYSRFPLSPTFLWSFYDDSFTHFQLRCGNICKRLALLVLIRWSISLCFWITRISYSIRYGMPLTSAPISSISRQFSISRQWFLTNLRVCHDPHCFPSKFQKPCNVLRLVWPRQECFNHESYAMLFNASMNLRLHGDWYTRIYFTWFDLLSGYGEEHWQWRPEMQKKTRVMAN